MARDARRPSRRAVAPLLSSTRPQAGRTLLPTTPHLETLEVEPDGPAGASVIWMHGLGADARDFYGIPPELGLPADLHVRYVFPNAPRMPVTINQGLIMQAWYDVAGFGARDQDERGIRRSAAWIDELIVHEVERGVPADRIVLGGFSQGGAMALFAGLRYPDALAGVICLSGYLLLPDALEAEASDANRSISIFQAHGTGDPMVPLELGQGTREGLERAGYEVDYHEYPMAHTVCHEEVRDVGDWLADVLD